ncbi:methyltransferase domain-containing protein [Alcaligenaceae bacterium A4P071]|nr:methyltransferase domain-containing protein [Alcaligenaceae bacterium A4P071]
MPAVPLDPVACIAHNLQQERLRRGLTLTGLAESSGISRNRLAEIESGTERPTIETIWRLARILEVPFGRLVRQPERDAAILQDDGVGIQLIDRQSGTRVIETYLMTLQPHAIRLAHAHGAAVHEHVMVLRGAMIVGPSAQPTLLAAGQSIEFASGTDHVYRSVEQPTTAMVTVIYPELSTAAGDYEHRRTWPQHHEDWDGLKAHLMRQQLEVAHGIDAYRIRFDGCPMASEQATALLAEVLLAPPALRQAATAYAVCEHQPAVIVLSRPHRHATLKLQGDEPAALADAIALVNRLAAPFGTLDCHAIQALQRTANAASLTHATLAAELLTRHSLPCVPGHIAHTDASGAAQPVADSAPARLIAARFEDRIDVDAYAAFELVHPGYATQCVAIAQALHLAGPTRDLHVLDVGTGPGMPLSMLLELCPIAHVTAVDPSPTAFAHLQRRFADEPRVTPIQADITQWLPAGAPPFDVAISVGASHHLNTAYFLQSVRRHLAPGALFVVADEMIMPFSTAQERCARLIAHHLQYIADTLVEVPLDAMNMTEASHVHRVRNDVPITLFKARAGLVPAAADRVRRLLKSIKAGTGAHALTHPLLAFHRFHTLELEALVAGLDYEVEQKTHPRRFADLAWHAGFEVRHHQRLYATHGDTEWDAGTHLFVLEARRPCT